MIHRMEYGYQRPRHIYANTSPYALYIPTTRIDTETAERGYNIDENRQDRPTGLLTPKAGTRRYRPNLPMQQGQLDSTLRSSGVPQIQRPMRGNLGRKRNKGKIRPEEDTEHSSNGKEGSTFHDPHQAPRAI